MKLGFNWVLIFVSVIMVVILIGVQIVRIYPLGVEIPADPYQGQPLLPYQSLIKRGSITLDVIGQYKPYSVMIFKNGDRILLVEQFPVTVKITDGDVLELWVLEELPGAALITAKTSENVRLKYSRTSIPLEKGLHRIAKVFVNGMY
ncbi:hypothetical protein Cst_c15130 [Thermoclostridium stercorarium subsp. stercorarium DSM 8532]|jgi:hypothetical protein|uniref:Uncharacterized protein n=3 Tax=Thermoclostridium stercorarium TaxID=1510 RepID=L7VPY9_THES1|nr:hypothetical protein [Thermoclostridium stercorarium]AGC68501.1 hypothetical protein Cst_c15130 [Thermoclostridium stercorarium subsp. stercorarium DSM 8532]AGI39519.1 hypothetical protein Clst_1461 [Thermoclostridium stercorarium subsp. stercorarium DSM 8532]ANW98860.1 hypothetical protein CSTERTH_07400 [Thermoclostridium stercorarium subsp. thermolacticum DSM 2910]ANX01385.1 hypothetical protein CSTERLE_07290 [Thermoclostridium stercorarium subsp. leptospartum DSM 9219]UZQ84488.1 hypothet